MATKKSSESRLTEFGKYLTELREASGAGTQDAVASTLAASGVMPMSQSLIAQHESGRVGDPKPEVLRALASLYGVTYGKIIAALVLEKYGRELDEAKERRRFLSIGFEPTRQVGEIAGLGASYWSALARLVTNGEVLDLKGVLEWVNLIPAPEEMWVVVPEFLDNEHEEVIATVEELVGKHGTTFVYFVRHAKGSDDMRDFMLVRDRLAKRLGDRVVKDHLKVVPIDTSHDALLTVNYSVANPRRWAEGGAIGFQYLTRLRRGDPNLSSVIALRMEDSSVRWLASRLADLVNEYRDFDPESVLKSTL